MTSVSEVFFAGVTLGSILGLIVGFLAAWALFRSRENRQIHQHVLDLTRTVTALVEAALKRKDPKRVEEEKPPT
jgi:ABC-type phosphate/phosphonate transport system permease subunit